jgi:predicted glycosyltransferase
MRMSLSACWGEIRHLMQLGIAFLTSALLMLGTTYAVRIIMMRDFGLEAAGLYQASWALGGVYVGFILQAMGSDFYPRLVESSEDDSTCNRLVNEQTEVGLLLAGPGMVGTLVLAPTILTVIYTTAFVPAADLLRWICLGMVMRVITWPIGFIIVAKARQAIFVATECAWAAVSIALAWVCVTQFGLDGAGIAFFGSYVFHALMIYPIVRRVSGFRWSRENLKISGLLLLAMSLVFSVSALLPAYPAIAIGMVIWLASCRYSIRSLSKVVRPDLVPRSIRRLLAALRLRPSSTALSTGFSGAETSHQNSVWIDLDNTPHVPFFAPIIHELHRRGCVVLLTSRDAYQVTHLARFHGLKCTVVGRHYGKNKTMKVVGLLIRAAQLTPYAMRHRPHIAVSHGSRAQVLVAKLLRIRSIVIADYEHVTLVTAPDVLLVPDVITDEATKGRARDVVRYPGIKEDVYVTRFFPSRDFRSRLGVRDSEILVTVRPPATEAHYHNSHSEALFAALMDVLGTAQETRAVLLPRNQRQRLEIERRWAKLVADKRVIVPKDALNGLDLIWHSDLVVSGGGTMNREAASLGVPVYSIFRGPIGAVDRYLAAKGKLTIVSTVAAVRTDIRLIKRARCYDDIPRRDSVALDAIVDVILNMLNGERAHWRRPAPAQ